MTFLPKNWVITDLKSIVEILDHKRIPINSKERQKRKENKKINELYPYYGATGQVDYIDDYLFDGEYILLGEDGAPFLNPLKNKAYFVSGKFWVNNHAHILRAKESLSSNKYIEFFLNYENLNIYISGTIRGKLTQEILRSILIPLPPLPEQKRIVEILSLAEDLIKKQKETIALIDKILMAKFLEMFGDPVTNPKGWEVRRLDEVILNMRHGISRKGIKKSLKNPLKCLRPSNINKQCKVNLSDVRIVKFSERDFNRAGLTKGELVISHLNGSIDHVGKCILFVFEDKWIFDSNLLAIKLNPEKINSYYSYWYRDTYLSKKSSKKLP